MTKQTLRTKLNKLVATYSSKEVLTPMDMVAYKARLTILWDLIRQENQRVINTKGTLRTNELRDDREYLISDFNNDVLRKSLSNEPLGYVTIIPRFITEHKYVSYEFKKVDEDKVIFITRHYVN
ncbi:MAG: hypothetical protein ACRCZ0_02630 [Cetobacterium sp.]